MFLLYILPKNFISYVFGLFAKIPWPTPIRRFLILGFSHLYKINLDEVNGDVDDFKSLAEFFVRPLKLEKRPLHENAFVHPADSVLTLRGDILEGKLLQAKGRSYTAEEFLGIRDPRMGDGLRKARSFYLTYYLSPQDYHRVHSPIRGLIHKVYYYPGFLWPVNDWSRENIDQLFAVNERVILEMSSDLFPGGVLYLAFVGATNVGSIELSFEPGFKTNHQHSREKRVIQYMEPVLVEKGEEIGRFCMGSTVIILGSEEFRSSVSKHLDFVGDDAPHKKVRVRDF